IGNPGVKAISGESGPFYLPCQGIGKRDISELREGIRIPRFIVRLPLEVVPLNIADILMGTGCNCDNAGGCAFQEQGKKQIGDKKRCEIVYGKGHLQPVWSQPSCLSKTPALLISTSSRVWREMTSAAIFFIWSRSDRSAIKRSGFSLPVFTFSSFCTCLLY